MVSESARTLDLLRQRDRQKRTMQVWLGLLVVWGVVVGWLVFLIVDSATGGTKSATAWLAYLLPLAALAIVLFLHWRRLRTIDTELVAATQADLKRG
jgi:Kef-type K+ transport system membrane component KefB